MTNTRKHTSTGHRQRYAALGAATAAIAATMLLPASGASAAQAQACPTDISAAAPSQVTSAEQTQILDMHNIAREAISTEPPLAPLTWDNSLAADAQGWADLAAAAASTGLLCHDPNAFNSKNQGENLAWFPSVQSGVQSWLNEQSRTDISTTSNFNHYTQMIWRKTTSIGCGKAPAGPNILLVCRYFPAGNITGQSPLSQ